MNNIEKLRVKFPGCETIDKSYSQINQDLFVLGCLQGKKNGKFLDLGCHDPVVISNTYVLEKFFGWDGIAIDIGKNRIDAFKEKRKCKSILGNCLDIDFNNLLDGDYDYLSIDLDPAETTYDVLLKLPLNRIRFAVITYEHDANRYGDSWKLLSRKHLKKLGYYLLCEDVNEFEDWYVHPELVDMNVARAFESHNPKGVYHSHVVYDWNKKESEKETTILSSNENSEKLVVDCGAHIGNDTENYLKQG